MIHNLRVTLKTAIQKQPRVIQKTAAVLKMILQMSQNQVILIRILKNLIENHILIVTKIFT